MSSTLFLGIGNTLLSDEGIGVHVINHLTALHADEPAACYLDGGTLSFTLAEAIASHSHLIVIDAARLNRPPGSMAVLLDDEVNTHLRSGQGSVHEVSLGDLLDIARLSGTLPRRMALIGIQPDKLDWGERPTAALADSISLAADEALRLHREWQSSTD
jgi:hydrogenase maturation protease